MAKNQKKKLKKIQEGTDVHGCAGTGGAGMLTTSLNARLLSCNGFNKAIKDKVNKGRFIVKVQINRFHIA